MPEDELPPQSIVQKQISFANNAEMVQAAIEIIKSSFEVIPLVGDTEYGTVVNAVKIDTQQNVMLGFLNRIEVIRQGALLNAQQP